MSRKSTSSQGKIISIVAKIAKQGVSPSKGWGWPPDCIGIYHQPKRPKCLQKHSKIINSK